jgi:hypothetical protein
MTAGLGAGPRRKLPDRFNGVRVVADLNFGTILQGGANQFDPGAFKGLTMAGLEWNVYSGLLSMQTTFLPPTPIQLDESSTLVTSESLEIPTGA